MSFLFRRDKDTDGSNASVEPVADAAHEELPETVAAEEQPHNTAAHSGAPRGSGRHAKAQRSSEVGDAGVTTRWRASSDPHANRQSKRGEYIARAYAQWHAELASNESAGVTAETLRASTVDLTHAHPTGAAQLYSGSTTFLSSLVREERSYERSTAQLFKLHKLVSTLTDAFGYASVSLTTGHATWASEGEAAHEHSPMLIRSVALEFLPDGDAKMKLARSLNMAPEYQAALEDAGASHAELAQVQALADSTNDADAVMLRLVELGRTYLPDFSHEQQVLLGCFTHPAESLVDDLEAMKPLIEQSGVFAAIAGDEELRALTSAPVPPGNPEDRSPEAERGVGDADVEELSIVEAVASGRSLVIDAPPGTQRLGTIVSIAADAAASGRSVLIIPASGAAGGALQRAFEAAGVGDLVLNFWKSSDVPLRLRTGLRLEKPALDRARVLEDRRELIETRSKISTFVNDLHRTDLEWGVSIHDMLQNLAELTAKEDGPQTRVRFTQESIRAIYEQGVDRVESSILRGAELGILDGSYSQSIWLDSNVSTEEEVAQALSLVRTSTASTIPEALAASQDAAQSVGITPAQTPQEWLEQLEMLEGISESLDTFLPKVFEQSPEDMVIATATKEWRESHGFTMKKSERRMILKQADDLVRPGANPADLHAELLRVQERQEVWKNYSSDGGWPILPPSFRQLQSQADVMRKQLSELSQIFGGKDFFTMAWRDLTATLAKLEEEEERVDTLPERNTLLAKLRELGLSVFLEDIKQRGVAVENVGAEFRLACTSSVFEQLMVSSPSLASLGPRDITDLLARLRTLDRKHTEILGKPVMIAAISQMRTFARAHRDATLSADAMLARGDEASLREAIATYPRIVQLARPVWIMPAGLVAEFLPAVSWADVCVLDAAPDVAFATLAACAMRGRQVVVCGDVRRAKLAEPSLKADKEVRTTFAQAFEAALPADRGASGGQVAEEPQEPSKAETIDEANPDASTSPDAAINANSGTSVDAVTDLDSASEPSGVAPRGSEDLPIPHLAISAYAEALPVLELPTSRVQLNEITAAALADYGYNHVYSPIPKTPLLQSTTLMLVDGRGMPSVGGDGAVESTVAEVSAVIDAIADHALDQPERSLAVVALNERHAARIREDFTKEASRSAVLSDFIRRNPVEPFVIVDLSQASGIYRDHVILAVGFGKTIHGRMLHSFGILAKMEGFLGLVDAIESARCELTVVSALTASDMRSIRVSTPGPQLLTQVLEAGENGFESHATGEQSEVDMPLISDLAARLEAMGWQTALNFGYPGSSKIPLVVGSSSIPGTWAVAVLLDDEEYVSEASLRRRDRHRIEAYESAGWSVFQTYSTSLFIDPAGQAQAISRRVETARDRILNPERFVPAPVLDSEGKQDHEDNSLGVSEASQSAASGAAVSDYAAADSVISDSVQREGSHPRTVNNPKERGARPDISVGLPLVAYTDDELDDMVAWISSDGVSRSVEELRDELRNELGIERRGGQIDLVLGNAVRRSGMAYIDDEK